MGDKKKQLAKLSLNVSSKSRVTISKIYDELKELLSKYDDNVICSFRNNLNLR